MQRTMSDGNCVHSRPKHAQHDVVTGVYTCVAAANCMWCIPRHGKNLSRATTCEQERRLASTCMVSGVTRPRADGAWSGYWLASWPVRSALKCTASHINVYPICTLCGTCTEHIRVHIQLRGYGYIVLVIVNIWSSHGDLSRHRSAASLRKPRLGPDTEKPLPRHASRDVPVAGP